MPTPDADIDKRALFAELGYGGDIAPYDHALHLAGLTNPRKSRVRLDKRDAIAAELNARFFRVCNRGDCRAAAASRHPDGRALADASSQDMCQICSGDQQQAAIDAMVHACLRAKLTRLVVVGGSPTARDALHHAVDHRLDLRVIDGTLARRKREALADLDWASLIIIWGSTPLDHKVSDLYTGPSVITCRKRGLGELAREIETAALRRT